MGCSFQRRMGAVKKGVIKMPSFLVIKTKIKQLLLKVALSSLTSPFIGMILGCLMISTHKLLNTESVSFIPQLGVFLFLYSFITFIMAATSKLGIPIFIRRIIGISSIICFVSGCIFVIFGNLNYASHSMCALLCLSIVFTFIFGLVFQIRNTRRFYKWCQKRVEK
jgi:hypothetical protein